MGLIFNGILKVPMQFFILLLGVMVFVFYQFNASPLNFNPKAKEAVIQTSYADEYLALEKRHQEIENDKRTLLLSEDVVDNKAEINRLDLLDKDVRQEAKAIIKKADSSVESNDKDYVFLHYILNNLPRGLIGLLLAVILSAAMSSTASELNALASTTALDLYKRNVKEEHSDTHYVNATKWFTLAWGIVAILIACVANLFDNLIQLVNIIGSIFYGNVLGIFLLAFFVKFVRGNAVFTAAIITQVIIIIVWYLDWLPYLWLNLLGCAIVMGIAIFLQSITKKPDLHEYNN
jgi:SSS family solute:Na+ symporter